MKPTQLLAPAGDIFRGKLSLDYGADAIYFGGTQFSLRARASNFTNDKIKEMCEYAHNINKKCYLVTNILCHNVHLPNLRPYLKEVMEYKPDAFITSDPAVITALLEINPNAEIHISTQQSTTNSKAALFWKRNGAKRIILAREISYEEVKLMHTNMKDAMDLEYFIHGAVCIGYSGRCMLSNNFCLRDSNIGGCAQSCRWKYSLYDENNKYSNTFSMSAKDMNQMPNLEKLIDCGIASFKIEGRMKTEHYCATVTKTYREAIDEYCSTGKLVNKDKYLKELEKVANRDVDVAWFNGLPTYKAMLDTDQEKTVTQLYSAFVEKKIDDSTYEVTSKNLFKLDQNFELIGPKHTTYDVKIKKITDQQGVEYKIVNQPSKKFIITFDKPLQDVGYEDILRIKQ
ncbi:MAG: U32 family peptidase [Malacoplasma sp.]|nr:U32 family peptidase [Malacoplasma sp.]